jgi:hypothetical protein
VSVYEVAGKMIGFGGGVGYSGSANTPAAPLTPVAIADVTSVYGYFGAPTSNGGSVLTQYTATAYTSPGGVSSGSFTWGVYAPVNGLSCFFRINGLTGGQAYTVKVKATNANGTGPESANSNAVTPSAYAAYYVTHGNNPGVSSPQNTGWGQFDFGSPANVWNSTAQVFTGETNSLQISSGVAAQPYFIDVLAPSSSVGAQAGSFNIAPYTNLVAYIYSAGTPGAATVVAHTRWHLHMAGVCTTGSGSNVVADTTANWSSNTMNVSPSFLSYFDGGGEYGQPTGNTATTISGSSRTWAPGDHYAWSLSDADFTDSGTAADLTQFVTGFWNGSSFTGSSSWTAAAWNRIVMPFTAWAHTTPTGGIPSTIQEFSITNTSGANIYVTDLGFA